MSNTQETPNTQPQDLPQEQPQQAVQTEAAQPAPRPRRTNQDRKRQRSVVFYISILFAAAFLLLSMSLMMERRQHAENLEDLNQSLSGLKDSVSAMQSVQQLYEENSALQERVSELEATVKELTTQIDGLNKDLKDQEKTAQAMDWFWQINEAYVRNRWTTARTLVQQMKDANLEDYLSQESVTDTGRFSPADRYQEIYDRLY